ncbi:MAG TPA: GNAT family N-acetyltransferase [Patescibacteria group bacterium]|nr:GNAT family N-acetyltransferase [Patescibacteria group bacterium]
MEIKKEIKKDSFCVRITIEEDGKEVGRARLYVMQNDLHTEPFGFLEDVFVEEAYRKKGFGKKLVEESIEEAKQQGCYKLIFTTRHTKPETQAWYEKMGFKNWGMEFRMDLVV